MPTAGIACCAGVRRRRCRRFPGPAWDPAPRRAARVPRCTRRCRRSGSVSSSQVRGAATVGWSRPRSEYGAMVVFDAVVLRPVDEHLPGRSTLRHPGHHQVRACPARWPRRSPWPAADASSEVSDAVQPAVQVDALGATGHRDQDADDPLIRARTARATSRTVRQCHARARVEVEDQPVGMCDAEGGLVTVSSDRPNRHCGTCSSSAAIWPSQARVAGESTTG